AMSCDLVHTQRILHAAHAACGRLLAAVQDAMRRIAGAGRQAGLRLRQLAAATQAPPDPLLDGNAPPLPGTSPRAFWVGLIVVSLPVGRALATFLILPTPPPIAPREQVVSAVPLVNLLLVTAMVAVIPVHAVGLWRAWKKKIAGARLHARIVVL